MTVRSTWSLFRGQSSALVAAAGLVIAVLAPACHRSGAASGSRTGVSNDGGPGADGGPDDASPGGDGAASPLVGRWWGVLPTDVGRTGVVMEVQAAPRGATVPVRVWQLGSPTNGTLSATAAGWHLAGGGCWNLAPATNGSPDRFEVTSCITGAPGTGILRRSRATRIYEAPVTPTALNFDAAGTRFGFATGGRFWLWDASRAKLADLGTDTAVPYAQIGLPLDSLAFSPDGRRVAYLRGGTGSPCSVANLVLFDAETGKEQALAAGVPCGAGFARFSPGGDALATFTNYKNDGTGADLTLWSVPEGAATVVASRQNPSSRDAYLFFGPSGRHLVYRSATPELGVGWNEFEALFAYDLTAKQSTMLAASARDVTPSADGGRVAWSTQGGQVGLWNDRDGSVRMLDPGATPPEASYGSGLSVSPDGRWFAYLGTDGAGHLHDAQMATTATLGAGGVWCHTETFPFLYGASAPTRMRAAHFAALAPGLVYWGTPSPRSNPCYAGDPSTIPFRYRDLGTGQEMVGPVLDFRRAFGPRGEVVGGATQTSVWSPTRGTTPLVDAAGTPVSMPSQVAIVFRSDGSQMVFAGNDSFASNPLWAWSAASGRVTQIAATLPTGVPFRFQADPDSGQVVFPAGSSTARSLMLHVPGATPATLLDMSDAPTPTLGPSGRVLAAHGVDAGEQGIFVFRFGTSDPVLIEEGQVLGVSETQVYFNAPDGVCVVNL